MPAIASLHRQIIQLSPQSQRLLKTEAIWATLDHISPSVALSNKPASKPLGPFLTRHSSSPLCTISSLTLAIYSHFHGSVLPVPLTALNRFRSLRNDQRVTLTGSFPDHSASRRAGRLQTPSEVISHKPTARRLFSTKGRPSLAQTSVRSFPHRQCLRRRLGRTQGRESGTHPSTHGRTHLRTPGSARPRRGARRRTSSDSMARRNARGNSDCQGAKTHPRRVQIGHKKNETVPQPILASLLRKCTRACAGPGDVNEPRALAQPFYCREPHNYGFPSCCP